MLKRTVYTILLGLLAAAVTVIVLAQSGPVAPAWSDLSTSTLTGPASVAAGDAAIYTATISNAGTTSGDSYVHVMHVPAGAVWQSSSPGMLPLRDADGNVTAALKWLPGFTGTVQLTTSVRYSQPGVATFYGVNSYKQVFVNLFTPVNGLRQETAVGGLQAEVTASAIPIVSASKSAWQWMADGCCTPGSAVTMTLWVTPTQTVSDASLWIAFPLTWTQNAGAEGWRGLWGVLDGQAFYGGDHVQQQMGAYSYLGDLAAPISVSFTGYYSAPVTLRADLYAGDRLVDSSLFQSTHFVYLPIVSK